MRYSKGTFFLIQVSSLIIQRHYMNSSQKLPLFSIAFYSNFINARASRTQANSFSLQMKLRMSLTQLLGKEQMKRQMNHWKIHSSSGRFNSLTFAANSPDCSQNILQKTAQYTFTRGKSSSYMPINISSGWNKIDLKVLKAYILLIPTSIRQPAIKFMPWMQPSRGQQSAIICSNSLKLLLFYGKLNYGSRGQVLSMSFWI